MTDQSVTGLLIGFVVGWLCGLTVASYRSSGRPPSGNYGSPRLDPGRVQRGNGSGGPYQPRPQIIPRGQRARIPNPSPSK
jgi:hypothetical protein